MNSRDLRPRCRLRLYIAWAGLYAIRAKQNLIDAAGEAGFDYELEVAISLRNRSVHLDPVVVTPTLIKLAIAAGYGDWRSIRPRKKLSRHWRPVAAGAVNAETTSPAEAWES